MARAFSRTASSWSHLGLARGVSDSQLGHACRVSTLRSRATRGLVQRLYLVRELRILQRNRLPLPLQRLAVCCRMCLGG